MATLHLWECRQDTARLTELPETYRTTASIDLYVRDLANGLLVGLQSAISAERHAGTVPRSIARGLDELVDEFMAM